MTKEKIIDSPLKSNLSYWISYKPTSTGIIEQIADIANLKLAWYRIKSNFASSINHTKLLNKVLVKENENWLCNISNKLLKGHYKYKKRSEINVLKNDVSFNSFKVVSFRDVVVQKAFFLVLSAIFEKQNSFWAYGTKLHKKAWKLLECKEKLSAEMKLYLSSKTYAGYRSVKKTILNDFFSVFTAKQNVHSVMRMIQINWKPLNYFAKYKIDHIFNKVNYSILIKGLEEYIKDKKVCNEIWKMFNSNNIGFTIKSTEFSSLYSPQSSVFASFLFNVYMIKFNRFLDSLIGNLNNKSTPVGNTKWLQIINNSLQTSFFFSRIKYFQLSFELVKIVKKSKARFAVFNKDNCKLFYARHIADFILGFYGKQNDIKKLLTRINIFIMLNLQLNCTSFRLINAYSCYVSYLGFRLKCFRKEKASSKHKFIRAFEKLKSRLIARKLNENTAYLKTLEWAGSKFYRKIVEQVVRNPKQVLVRQGINLKNVLALWGQRDGLIYLITVLKQSLRSFDLTIENSDSSIDEQYYKAVEQFRENQCKEFFQRWSEAAKILARTDIDNGVKEFLPSKIVHIFDVARSNFLLQINKLCQIKINMTPAKKLDLIPNKLELFSMNNMSHIMWNYSIKVHINAKHIMEKLREQGIVNKRYCPICFKRICSFEDYNIINKIATKAYALMHFYSCVNNLWYVKKLVNYILRYSLASTLARKFKVSLKKIFQIYGKDLSVRIKFRGKTLKVASFPSKSKVDSLKYEFSNDIISYDRLSRDLLSVPTKTIVLESLHLFKMCGVVSCQTTHNIEIYRVATLICSRKSNLAKFYSEDYIGANFCWRFLEFVFRCKTVPLCREHHLMLNNGFLAFSDLNLDFIIQPTRVLKSYSIVENVGVKVWS